jgi:abhydrolase domain-containing protein 14
VKPFAPLLLGLALPGLLSGAEPGTIEIAATGDEVHFLTAGPEDGRPVLLLHGARFDATTWEGLGTLDLLAEAGYRAIALDLPGYGRSWEARGSEARFLGRFIRKMKLAPPVVVSPSMSGRFAYPLATEQPHNIAGLVALAPAGTPEFAERLASSNTPLLVVWGSQDTVFPLEQGRRLVAAVAGSRLVVLEGAGHPSYLDRPDPFHEALLAFLSGLGESS